MNALSTAEEFVHFFAICRPKLLVVEFSLLESANEALSRTSGLASTKFVILGRSPSTELAQVCILPSHKSSHHVEFNCDISFPVTLRAKIS